ncbi:MAG: 23S rRNA (adenine(2503)-C(2))-methyltransferase RlmN [Gammaproteobacteria bacterium]|nr:23S rRNA (adenine(2503)-C(2))-methyltransferase RlmN [Gammaproteobacteria bacterium]
MNVLDNQQVNLQPLKQNLLGMTLQDLEAFFIESGEKAFRASQVMKWLHQMLATDFDAMTNISKSLRETLKQTACIDVPAIVFDQTSSDGTRKWVMQLDAGNKIETVYIPESGRGTLCISSQVGCALDCSFCSTARQGFSRNLTAAEIVAQVFVASILLGKEHRDERKITNIVLMGMGEPLLNYDNVLKAITIFMEDNAYGLSKRRVTLSTSGVIPKLDLLGQQSDVALAVSLHAVSDAVRDSLVPINQKYPLKELMASCRQYINNQTAKSHITFEYVMLNGVNDSRQDAVKLVKLLKGIPAKVNLIPFNPFPDSGYDCSPMSVIKEFKELLMQAGLVATIRKTRGEDIDAACGQLVGKVEDKSRREKKFQDLRYGMS